MLDLISRYVVQWVRPWANQAHFASQDVPQLRQLVDAVAPQEGPNSCKPRIARHFEKRSGAVVVVSQAQFQVICVPDHSPEFVTTKEPALSPHALSTIENRPRRIQLDQSGDYQQ
jgi:hypothetical protein